MRLPWRRKPTPEVTFAWDDAHGGWVRTPVGSYELTASTFVEALKEARTIIARDCKGVGTDEQR